MPGKKNSKEVVYGQVVEGHLVFLDVNKLQENDYQKRAELPEDLEQKYGEFPMNIRIRCCMKARYEKQILNGLKKAGYTFRRDNSMVSRILGWGKPKGKLVYAKGLWHGEEPHLIFIEEEHAIHYAYLNKVIRGAEKSGMTWGEFREREPVAYDSLFEDHISMDLDEWVEQMASSKDKAYSELKNDVEKIRGLFSKDVPLPERMPFDDETFCFEGNFRDSVEFMLTFGGEGNMLGIIPDDVIARYGYADETRWGDEYLILKSRFRKKIVEALGRYGYKCEENYDLVARAVGWI